MMKAPLAAESRFNLDEVEGLSYRYAYRHRTKNNPRVFTNPKMVVKYPNSPNRWRCIYRGRFLPLRESTP